MLVLIGDRGYAIYVNEWFGPGIFNIVVCLRGYIGDLALADLEAIVLSDYQFALAGKKNEQLLAVLCAVQAAGLAGR